MHLYKVELLKEDERDEETLMAEAFIDFYSKSLN